MGEREQKDVARPQCRHSEATRYAAILARQRPWACALAKRVLEMRSRCSVLSNARIAKRNCPTKCFREGSPHCRACERETIYRIAPGVTAEPREKWAKDLISRLR